MDDNGPDKKDLIARDDKGRWLPGTVPNPKGRPPASECMGDWIRRLAERPHPGSLQNRTRGELVALAVYKAAIEGDMRACKLILERIDPPPPTQAITINNNVSSDAMVALDAMKGSPDKMRALLDAHGFSRNGSNGN